jgi:hypothetical protein
MARKNEDDARGEPTARCVAVLRLCRWIDNIYASLITWVVLARDFSGIRLWHRPSSFYHKFLQRPYPFAPAEQGITIPFWETGIQFITLNSCWEIDAFHRQRAGLHPDAVAHAIAQAQQQEADARKAGQLLDPTSSDATTSRKELSSTTGMTADSSGCFGARAADRPESTPRLYNVLAIARDLKSIRVHTRYQPTSTSSWEGWHRRLLPEQAQSSANWRARGCFGAAEVPGLVRSSGDSVGIDLTS